MTELKKELSLYGLTMVAIGSCIGSGIFLTPSQIAGYLPAPLLILLVWALGGVFIALMIAISTFGTLGIYTLSAPRIYYAMAKDGLFFKQLAYIHPRFRTPVNAILVQSAWAVVLLLFWGTFEDLITYVVFTDWVFFGLTAVGIFIFRRTRKDLPRPYRTIGYPVVPLIFITITFLFVANALIAKPLHAWAGLILMAASLPIYFYFKRRSGDRS